MPFRMQSATLMFVALMLSGCYAPTMSFWMRTRDNSVSLYQTSWKDIAVYSRSALPECDYQRLGKVWRSSPPTAAKHWVIKELQMAAYVDVAGAQAILIPSAPKNIDSAEVIRFTDDSCRY